MHAQVAAGIAALDRNLNLTHDVSSDRLIASLARAAKAETLTRVDAVVLGNSTSTRDRNVFAVQGEPNAVDRKMAFVSATQALQQPVSESLERIWPASRRQVRSCRRLPIRRGLDRRHPS